LDFKQAWEKEKTEKETLKAEIETKYVPIERFKDACDANAPLLEEQDKLKDQCTKATILLSELQDKLAAFENFEDALVGLLLPRFAELVKTLKDNTTSMQGPSEVGLQTVTTVVDVPAAIKRVTITEDTIKGKVFALAKKGFFDGWKTSAEVHKQLIDDANYCTSAAVNEALNQLVKDGLFGMKHTDRNRFKLAPNVVFEGKEVESQ